LHSFRFSRRVVVEFPGPPSIAVPDDVMTAAKLPNASPVRKGGEDVKPEEIWAIMAVEQAEKYAALAATFGADAVDAMLMFPWSPEVPEEGAAVSSPGSMDFV